MSNNKKYIILDATEISTIDFNQVQETSNNTLRYNLAGTQTVVKYLGDMPSCIIALTTKQGPYTHSEIKNILAGPDWFIDTSI